MARMQLLIAVRPGAQPPSPDRAEVEAEVAKATRRWSDDLADLLTIAVGRGRGRPAAAPSTAGALPEAYKEDFGTAVAVRDITRLEALPDDDGLAFDLYTPDRATTRPTAGSRCSARARRCRSPAPCRSSPRWASRSSTSGPTRSSCADGETVWIYDFGLHLPAGTDLDDVRAAQHDRRRPPAVARARSSRTGSTSSSSAPAMTWWQVNVLRAYARYLRQAGTPFSQGYIEQTLIDNAAISTAIVELFESRFDPARVAEAPLVDADGGKVGRTDLIEAAAGRGRQPRPGPHPALAAAPGERDPAHQRLPHRRARREHPGAQSPRGRRAAIAIKLDPRRIPEPAAAAPALRDLGLLAAGRGRAPALRPRRARRPALVGPARGLPHRDPRPGQGADGQERRHRPDRRQGRLRRQEAARPGAGPRGLAGRGRRLLPHVHLLPARPHRQLRRRRRRRAAGRAAAADPPLRRRRPVPRRRGRQGHRDVQRHRQRDRRRLRLLARRRVRQRRLGRLRPQGHGHHRARRVGVGEVPLPRAGPRHPDSRTSPSSASATCPATSSATACCCPSTSGWSPPSTTGTSSSTRPRTPRASFAERRRLFELPRSSWADYDAELISAGGGVYPRTAEERSRSSPQVAAALGLPVGHVRDDARPS